MLMTSAEKAINRIGPRTEPLGTPGSDCHCPGSSAVEPDELSVAREVGLDPLDDSSRNAELVFEPIEKDLVVDRV